MVGLNLIKDVIVLLEQFESENHPEMYDNSIDGFRKWIVAQEYQSGRIEEKPSWENQDKGRSPESVICTLFVHLNTYAKRYSKAAVLNSEFIGQEDFIYLITLKAFGAMSKMELVRKNLHEKPFGISIINRLTTKGWIEQRVPENDRRKKLVALTQKGSLVLNEFMPKIRTATKIVSVNLTDNEKHELIRILTKLDHFHKDIFSENHDPADLLDRVEKKYLR